MGHTWHVYRVKLQDRLPSRSRHCRCCSGKGRHRSFSVSLQSESLGQEPRDPEAPSHRLRDYRSLPSLVTVLVCWPPSRNWQITSIHGLLKMRSDPNVRAEFDRGGRRRLGNFRSRQQRSKMARGEHGRRYRMHWHVKFASFLTALLRLFADRQRRGGAASRPRRRHAGRIHFKLATRSGKLGPSGCAGEVRHKCHSSRAHRRCAAFKLTPKH